MALVEECARERVQEAIRSNGGQPLDFHVARDGLRFRSAPRDSTRHSHVHRPDGRLQPIWSFVLAVAFSVAAYLICGDVAYTLEGEHTLRFELVFRTMLALLLFGLYFWLLTVADQVESNANQLARFAGTSGLAAAVFRRLSVWRCHDSAGGCACVASGLTSA